MVAVSPLIVIGSAPPTVRVLAVNVIPALSTNRPLVLVKTTRPLVNPLAFSVCVLTCVADKLPVVLNCAAFMVDADTLPEVLIKPVEFNAPVSITAAEIFAVVLINPLELTAANVVVPVAFNAPLTVALDNTLFPVTLNDPKVVAPVTANLVIKGKLVDKSEFQKLASA